MQGQLGLDPARIGIKGEAAAGSRQSPHSTHATGRTQIRLSASDLSDDRDAQQCAGPDPYVGEFVWTQANNYFGWRRCSA